MWCSLFKSKQFNFRVSGLQEQACKEFESCKNFLGNMKPTIHFKMRFLGRACKRFIISMVFEQLLQRRCLLKAKNWVRKKKESVVNEIKQQNTNYIAICNLQKSLGFTMCKQCIKDLTIQCHYSHNSPVEMRNQRFSELRLLKGPVPTGKKVGEESDTLTL